MWDSPSDGFNFHCTGALSAPRDHLLFEKPSSWEREDWDCCCSASSCASLAPPSSSATRQYPMPLAPSSELDDIFARKAKTTTLQTNQSSFRSQTEEAKKKHSETQTPAPEIVLDPSTQPSSAPKSIPHDRSVPPKKKRKVVETKFDQVKFRNTRGTGPRKRILCHELR